MSTYKRRIVYLSDKEWEGLGVIAKAHQSTISATIRTELEDVLFEEFERLDPAFQATLPSADDVRGILAASPQTQRDELPVTKLPGGGIQARQSQRDELLRKINRSK